MTELKEDLLQKVNGGTFDWGLFYDKLISGFKQPQVVISEQHKELIEAIKNKDFIKATSLVISFLSVSDEVVTKAYLECMLDS